MRHAKPRRTFPAITSRTQAALWFGAWLTFWMLAFAPVSP